ncbi:unnamed protein product [Amoebophrya sp. A25]|nr:unnamed protein product [Amoebophrya sp. A25]|eukprot:GSA25T00001539001.1
MGDADVTTVIFPPPEMRGIIDKMAEYVGKNGIDFEKRAMQEKSAKLSFLNLDNPYRPYYDYLLREIRARDAGAAGANGTATANGPSIREAANARPQALQEIEREEEEKKKKREAKKQSKNAIFGKSLPLALTNHAAHFMGDPADYQLAKVDPGAKPVAAPDGNSLAASIAAMNLKEPAPDEYSVPAITMAPLDRDIMKVTAQFVARNGAPFLESLSNRESANPQYEFLKPTHHYFTFFTKLCDAYTKILTNPAAAIAAKEDEEGAEGEENYLNTLKKIASDREYIIARALDRFKWDQKQKQMKEDKDAQKEEQRERMEAIDWHDFVIAETITFTEEDDNIPLQAPLDFSKIKIEKPLDPEMMPTILEEEEKMDVSDDEKGEDEEPSEEMAAEELVAEGESPSKKLDPSIPKQLELEEIAAPEEVNFDNVVVRTDYVRQKKTDDTQMQVCPLTGQLVAANEMPNHMRILLMDPQYKYQRDKALEKARSENIFIDDVDRNLGAFAAMRPDLFGTIEEEMEVAAEAGDEAIARQAGADAGPAHTVYNPEAAFLAHNRPGKQEAPPLAPSLRRGRDDEEEFDLMTPQNPEDRYNAESGEESDDEPLPKRQKLMHQLQAEREFAVRNQETPAVLLIQISNELQDSNVSELEVTLKVTTKISQLKNSLCAQLGHETGKVKFINLDNNMVLRSKRTLAYYNVGKGSRLRLEARKYI